MKEVTFGEYLQKLRKDGTDLSRERAAEAINTSASRLEKIERGELEANSEDVANMAQAYNVPELCSYYCANECPVGKSEYVNVGQAEGEDLAHILVSLLHSINTIEDQKNRFIEISADDKLDPTELRDFARISKALKGISEAAGSLNVWLQKEIIEGRVDETEYSHLMETLELFE